MTKRVRLSQKYFQHEFSVNVENLTTPTGLSVIVESVRHKETTFRLQEHTLT